MAGREREMKKENNEEDEALLALVGMTISDVDAIAAACEAGDYSMWDSSKVSYGSPFEEEMTTVSVRLPKSRIEAMNRVMEEEGLSRSEFVRRAIDQKLVAS